MIPSDITDTDQAALIIRLMSIMMGLWLWGLAMWFFIVSVGSLWKYCRPNHKLPFQMTWWSFVFPNTALVSQSRLYKEWVILTLVSKVVATEALGKALNNRGLQIFGCVFAGCLIIVWMAIFVTMLLCLKNRQLLWPKEGD